MLQNERNSRKVYRSWSTPSGNLPNFHIIAQWFRYTQVFKVVINIGSCERVARFRNSCLQALQQMCPHAARQYHPTKCDKSCRNFKTEYFDINDFAKITLICDSLGPSWIVQDLLHLSAVGTLHVSIFCVPSKSRAYRYGIGQLFDSMKHVRAISNINATLVNVPDNISVNCVEEWYGFVRKEAKKVSGQDLTGTEAFLQANSGLER